MDHSTKKTGAQIDPAIKKEERKTREAGATVPSRYRNISKSRSVRAGRSCLFGAPALLDGEDSDAYSQLLAKIFEAADPQDIFEEALTYDYFDLQWEISRLRQLQNDLLEVSYPRGLLHVLNRICGHQQAEHLVNEWLTGTKKAAKEVQSVLNRAGLYTASVRAETLSIMINDFERIDRIIMQKEGRRNSALREIDRHRSTMAQSLKRVSEEIQDAEYVELDSHLAAPDSSDDQSE